MITASDIRANTTGAHIDKVASCLYRVRAEIMMAEAMPPGIDRRRRLVQARVDYKRLTGWLPKTELPATAAQWSRASLAKAATQRTLADAARRDGLFSKFSGVLVSGFALADSNDAATPAATTSGATSAAPATPAAKGSESTGSGIGNILWQSRHFGEQSIREKIDVDLSVGGRLGMQPVLTIVKPSAAAGTAASAEPATPTTTHQNAFVWSAGLQAHAPFETIDAELGAYASLGSALLTTVPKVLGSGSSAQLALPLNGTSDANAWRWESGLTFDIFDNDLNQIHAEGGTLTPQFQALVAWRRDDRFSGVTEFKGPTDRLLFRLTLDAIRVFDKRQVGETAKTYTVSFVVEKERAWGRGANRLPSAMRYLVRGDIDLLNAVAPGAAAAAAAKSEAAPSIAWTAALPGPQALAVGKVARVTIAVNALTTSDQQSVKTTPAPTMDVTAEKPGALAVPLCPGASIAVALADGTVRLTTTGWTDCKVISADLAVTAFATGPTK